MSQPRWCRVQSFLHFCMMIFWQLAALPKCTSISLKNCPSYSGEYNLQNGIQFGKMPIPNTENGDFKGIEYPSIYIAVLLAVHVFDCDITGVPCNATIIWNLYSIATMKNKIPGYIFMKLKTTFWTYISQFLSQCLSDYRFLKLWSIWILLAPFQK